MTDNKWKAFCGVREEYRSYTDSLIPQVPELKKVQEELLAGRDGGSYPLETPIVFNKALDDLSKDDDIKLILVADNPGRREQEEKNQRYLVGPSGKIADGFFKKNPEMDIDFRKNVIILNKTPIHTARTAELKTLAAMGGANVEKAITDSQKIMAEQLYKFQKALGGIPVWIIGYSEMKKKGIFEVYTDTIKSLYPETEPMRNNIFLYRHFSMNQFSFDLIDRRQKDESTPDALRRIGQEYRLRILGW